MMVMMVLILFISSSSCNDHIASIYGRYEAWGWDVARPMAGLSQFMCLLQRCAA